MLDFARRHGWDEAHCRQVTALALSLFDQTVALHGLGPPERELLEAAGLLHDVGYAVAQSSRHKHSLYLIRNAALDGWSTRELLLMANVARYHRKALPSARHADYMALKEPNRAVARRLAARLRVAGASTLTTSRWSRRSRWSTSPPPPPRAPHPRRTRPVVRPPERRPVRDRVHPPGHPGRHRGRLAWAALRVPRADAPVG